MMTVNAWLNDCTKIDSYLIKQSEQRTDKNATVIYSSLSNEQEVDNKSNSRLWGRLFELHYKSIQGKSDSVFNTDVWKNSYDGSPLPKEEMDEWVANTVSKFSKQLTSKSKVLEVGCGNGLIFSSIIENICSYTACDPAETALSSLASSDLGKLHKQKISLHCLDAIEVNKIPSEKFDLIIINSVAQYFPNVDYLLRFIKKLQHFSHVKTQIFLGDLRSFDLQRLFYFDILYFKFKNDKSQAEYSKLIDDLQRREKETLYGADFFRLLPKVFNWITNTEVELKNGRYENELNRYRYDVILSCSMSKNEQKTNLVSYDWKEDGLCKFDLEKNIDSMVDQTIEINNIPNQRLLNISSNFSKLVEQNNAISPDMNDNINDHLSTEISFYYELAERHDVNLNIEYMSLDKCKFKAKFSRGTYPKTQIPSGGANLRSFSNKISGPPNIIDEEFESEFSAKFNDVELIKASTLLMDILS